VAPPEPSSKPSSPSKKSPPSIPPSASSSTSRTPSFVSALLRWANEAQKHHYLPLLGETLTGAYALSEASSGSDAFALQCRATLQPDGDYLLNGSKLWITNAIEAGLFLVFATLDPALGYKGITCFLVAKNQPGFTLGRKEDKLGIRASSTCELLFNNCRIPAANILGEPGKGYRIAIETLNEGRIGIGAQLVGLASGAWRHAARYARERQQFGKPLAECPGHAIPARPHGHGGRSRPPHGLQRG